MSDCNLAAHDFLNSPKKLYTAMYVFCSGSGVDTPLMALRELLGEKARTIKYLILVFK